MTLCIKETRVRQALGTREDPYMTSARPGR